MRAGAGAYQFSTGRSAAGVCRTSMTESTAGLSPHLDCLNSTSTAPDASPSPSRCTCPMLCSNFSTNSVADSADGSMSAGGGAVAVARLDTATLSHVGAAAALMWCRLMTIQAPIRLTPQRPVRGQPDVNLSVAAPACTPTRLVHAYHICATCVQRAVRIQQQQCGVGSWCGSCGLCPVGAGEHRGGRQQLHR